MNQQMRKATQRAALSPNMRRGESGEPATEQQRGSEWRRGHRMRLTLDIDNADSAVLRLQRFSDSSRAFVADVVVFGRNSCASERSRWSAERRSASHEADRRPTQSSLCSSLPSERLRWLSPHRLRWNCLTTAAAAHQSSEVDRLIGGAQQQRLTNETERGDSAPLRPQRLRNGCRSVISDGII